MTVGEILEQWLEEHGYDGLGNSYYECTCEAKGVGLPCGNEISPDCEAMYEHRCFECEKIDDCEVRDCYPEEEPTIYTNFDCHPEYVEEK